MKIQIDRVLDGGVYRVTISTLEWSERDRGLMVSYGEPEINVGGEFGVISDTPTFTLSDKLVRVMTESPFTQGFDSQDEEDAEEWADTWATEIVARLKAAIDELRANSDGFSGETVETY